MSSEMFGDFFDEDDTPEVRVAGTSGPPNCITIFGPRKAGLSITVDRDAEPNPTMDALVLEAMLVAFLPRETLTELIKQLGNRLMVPIVDELIVNFRNQRNDNFSQATRPAPPPKKPKRRSSEVDDES